MRLLLRLFLLLLLASHAVTAATPDETARFLAGLTLDGTSLAGFSNQRAWMTHATEFESAWKQLETRQLAKIRAWGPEHLQPEYSAGGNVFYFFSGPDQLYAGALFPRAENCVLVAREPIGELPAPDRMPAEEIAPSLANLRETLNAVLSFSFFITEKMKADLHHQQLSGTLPVIMVFLARSGAHLESVEFFGLDKSGIRTEDPKPATRAVEITFTRPGAARPQHVFYVQTDLSDDMLKRNPSVLRFCEALGRGSSLLKAASYLMHEGGFATIKRWILSQSDLVVQDDSGIPLRDFGPAHWAMHYFGRYEAPIKIFAKHAQPDLAQQFRDSAPGPLGFSFGYQWQPSKSGLILARREP